MLMAPQTCQFKKEKQALRSFMRCYRFRRQKSKKLFAWRDIGEEMLRITDSLLTQTLKEKRNMEPSVLKFCKRNEETTGECDQYRGQSHSLTHFLLSVENGYWKSM